MPKAKIKSSSESSRKIRPAISPEARENQLINLAFDLVEQRLLDGTASSQETTHFLKQGTAKYRREIEKLEEENKLLRAKTENLQSQKHIEELYADALKAMTRYSGQEEEDEEWDD